MNTRQALGQQIKNTRKAIGKTQAELSVDTSINKTTLSEIENGRFTGSLAIYERYLDALDLTLKIEPKVRKLPNWEAIDKLFSEDDE